MNIPAHRCSVILQRANWLISMGIGRFAFLLFASCAEAMAATSPNHPAGFPVGCFGVKKYKAKDCSPASCLLPVCHIQFCPQGSLIIKLRFITDIPPHSTGGMGLPPTWTFSHTAWAVLGNHLAKPGSFHIDFLL